MKTVTEIDLFDCVKSNILETFETPSIPTRHYLDAFQQYQKKKSIFKIIKFNWAAFLFGPFWFLYRKMYLLGFILLFVAIILEYSFPEQFSLFYYNTVKQLERLNPVGIFLNLFIMLVIGFIATPLYIWVCKKRIEKFSKKSGTTLMVPLLIAILFVVVIFVFDFTEDNIKSIFAAIV